MITQLFSDLVVVLAVVASVVIAFKRLAPSTFVRCHWALLNSPLGKLLPQRWRRVSSGAPGGCGGGGCGSGCSTTAGSETKIAPNRIGRR